MGDLEEKAIPPLFFLCFLACLQGVDRGVEETLKESRESLRETLDSVVSLTGQLGLARRVQDRILSKSLHPTEECGVSTVSDEFFSVHVSSGGR